MCLVVKSYYVKLHLRTLFSFWKLLQSTICAVAQTGSDLEVEINMVFFTQNIGPGYAENLLRFEKLISDTRRKLQIKGQTGGQKCFLNSNMQRFCQIHNSLK